MKSLLTTIICILLCNTSIVFAQQHKKIDSLISQLERVSGKEKIDLYNQIGWEYRLSYPDSTFYYCQLAIEYGEKHDLQYGTAQAKNYMGVASIYQGKYSQAFTMHKQALFNASASKDSSQIAHAYNSLGRLFFSQGDQIESYQYYHKALNIFTQIGDQQGASYCYKSLAELYALRNEYDKSEDMLFKALKIRKNLHDDRGVVSVYKELASISTDQYDYSKAHEYLNIARDISTQVGDQVNLAEIDLSTAELYYKQERYNKSLLSGLSALTIAQNIDNQQLLANINLLLGKTYLYKRNLYTARQHLEKVIRYAENSKLLGPLTDAHYYLAQVHEELQSYKTALFYHQKYINYKDSLFNVEKAKNMERLETRLLLKQKEYEYKILEASAAQKEFTIRQEKSKNIAQNIIIVLALVLLTVFILFFNRSNTQNKLLEIRRKKIEQQHKEISFQNEKISEQYMQLELQNKKLQKVNQEKDTLMNIVAHDLKSPLNRLSGLSDLLMLPNQDSHERERYASMIKETSQVGVNLVQDLLDMHAFTSTSGFKYTDLNLKQFLSDQAKSHESAASNKSLRMHVKCDAYIDLRSDLVYLSRIMDNLLSNAIKFSYAETDIFINGGLHDKHHFEISVEDQGPGFSEEDKKHLYKKFTKLSARPTHGESSHGLGLAIVKTLVDKMGGQIYLDSKTGEGSKFTLVFPLNDSMPLM